MKRLYYIRHGLSELNLQGLFAGHTDTPLTDEGRRQALQAGKDNKDLSIDMIICSPLQRAKDTARLFAEGAGLDPSIIQLNDLLLERNFGSLEVTPWSRELSVTLLDDNLPEGVEPWSSLLQRARQLVDYASQLPAENILLVGHGAIGRSIRKVIDPHTDIHAVIPNAELVRWI